MRFVFLFILLSIIYLDTYAQATFKTEYMGSSAYRKKDKDSDERFGDAKGSAIIYKGGINIPLSTKLDYKKRPTLWSVGAYGAYASLTNKHFTEDLVIDEIMNLGLSINHLRPIGDKWSILLSAGGGIYAPSPKLSKVRWNQVLASGAVVFIRQIRPNLQLGGGVALNNSFGFPMVFPALYLNWDSQTAISLRVSLMQGLEVSAKYDANKYLDLNMVVEMDGQMALLEKDGQDKIFTHQYIIVGFRPEIKLGNRIRLPFTAGLNATRGAEFSNRSLKNLFKDTGNYFQFSPYFSAGVSVAF